MSKLRSAILGASVMVVTVAAAASAEAGTLYSNGFETDTTGWFATTRVASGTDGITSADGSFHAVKASGATYTNFGGYNFGAGGGVATVFQEYWTSIDIYLNVDGGWANSTEFDWSSAINNSSGNHLQDFIFNGGFYNDGTGPGANTNRFVISASNNSQPGSAYAKNPARSPIAISTTGWYTFEHHFYDNGGFLGVDMTILDSSDTVVNTWTAVGGGQAIAGVGGNRYGWFDYNEFSTLAFDNSSLRTADVVPLPPAAWSGIALLGAVGGASFLRRRRNRELQA